MREVESAKRMTKLLNREITAVVDPTFLLNKNEWINNMGLGEKKTKINIYCTIHLVELSHFERILLYFERLLIKKFKNKSYYAICIFEIK